MNLKLVLLIAVVSAVVGSLGGVHVLAQANQPTGQWQMVAGASGGDGGIAWKFNTDTGQSFYCYRLNCYASILAIPPRQYTSRERGRVYGLLSEAASHASYTGFSLLTNEENLGEVGPFFNDKKLTAWLTELVMRLMHAAVILASNHEGEDRALLVTRLHYLNSVNTWTAKYFPKK
jgi:hypothetical protein